jgi:hypothetical protein
MLGEKVLHVEGENPQITSNVPLMGASPSPSHILLAKVHIIQCVSKCVDVLEHVSTQFPDPAFPLRVKLTLLSTSEEERNKEELHYSFSILSPSQLSPAKSKQMS